MSRNLSSVAVLGLMSVLATGTLSAADQANTMETRLRGLLQSTMLQLQTAQNDNAALISGSAEMQGNLDTLKTQVAKLTKNAIADKTATDSAIQDLKARNATQESHIAELAAKAAKLEADLAQAVESGRKTEAERAKLAAETIALNRRVADMQTKNDAMYKIGKEILSRYEKFGLGDALTAREPFIGVTRIKLQNLVQDYQDKLADQKVAPAR